MNLRTKKKLVLLGMMSRHPVAGVVWQTVHYLVGFQRLGYEVYYVETAGLQPSSMLERDGDDRSAGAAAFIASVMDRFDLGDRWAFHALHSDGRCYGMSVTELGRLYRSAELIVNLHGATEPRPDLCETGRLIYLETDPVAVQIELDNNVQQRMDYLAPHRALLTYGENIGKPGCGLPISERFRFLPTRQPVVLDFWPPGPADGHTALTTIGNWQQGWREVTFRGEVYHWSKHHEFLKVIDLPRRTEQPFELALGSYTEADRQMLESHGWRVRHALDFAMDLDEYRSYITRSRGEFTVAKDQNVRLRSGWFSDRSATYLAAGRPVITQETGFSDILPVGEGLFSFSTLDDILQAVDSINTDYPRHCRAALEIARECFDSNVVLSHLLADIGF